MSKNIKIIICGIIAILAVSLLHLVIPITDTFIISYIFFIIAISGVVGTLCVYGKSTHKAIIGLSYINAAAIYTIVNVMFSIIAYIVLLSGLWTFVIHAIILSIFLIIFVTLNLSGNYISNLDNSSEEKHKEFLKEKETYWK